MVYLRGYAPSTVAEGSGAAGQRSQTLGAGVRSEPPPTSKPHFDFYTILPEREIEIAPRDPAGANSTRSATRLPERELEIRQRSLASPPSQRSANAAYVLQVGSFRRFQDADRSKASLALLGLSADIQRVVINGDDVWYRVRLGPFDERPELDAVRARLTENEIDSLLLRIGQ